MGVPDSYYKKTLSISSNQVLRPTRPEVLALSPYVSGFEEWLISKSGPITLDFARNNSVTIPCFNKTVREAHAEAFANVFSAGTGPLAPRGVE